ncbi:G-type lectin S-receptor-like serine/threonine-protein kinase At4g27290 [Mangifera indica]|uniref:G-type lectin S-receptor-like serine/threonine-protein kinase At4g27290 n=1 Tax=Mangifera indica TaxID=29780 RepID=UPI001CF9D14A|nr:G-type lectin S-receptor-like serine/threonine-protein kinase At4g27290 [Mangifera indica]
MAWPTNQILLHFVRLHYLHLGTTLFEKDDPKEALELPLFELDTISDATDNFSVNMKLAEDGLGAVYKGTLLYGQEIMVKRLSKISRQGLNEFRIKVIGIL